MKKEPLLFKDFNGGWNTETASDEIAINESPDMVNVDFTKGGSIKKADGFVELGEDDDDGKITGIIKTPNRNGDEWLFKFSGANIKIYDDVNEVWNIIKTGLTEDQKWGNEVFDNIVYLCSTIDSHLTIDLGQIGRLASDILLGATSIELEDASTFDSSGNVYINNTLVTYTGKSTNTLTGCSNAIATSSGYLCVKALSVYASTPKGNITAIFGGRLMIAGVTGSGGAVIYGSKATDRTDFSITGGAAANDAIAEAMDSKINSVRVFHDDNSYERLMIFTQNNSIYSTNIEDDATFGTLFSSSYFKKSVTAINHFSTVVGQNDIFHIDLNNQIRTLGPNDDGSGKNYSDSISLKHRTLFRDEYDFSDARSVIVDGEYWIITKEGTGDFNNRILIYDTARGAWKKRAGGVYSDIVEYKGKVTISSQAENKVFQVIPKTLTDDGKKINFKYALLDVDYSPLTFERLRAVRISGIISKNCNLTVKMYRDFGSVLLGEFTISGENSEIIGSIADVSSSYGSVAFGDVPFGGDEDEDKRFFIANLDLRSLPDLENFRIVAENKQAGVYLEISKIKPIIFSQDEEYFPENYIL